MARKKKEEVVEAVVEEVVAVSGLEERRAFLLDLIATMNREGFRSVSNIEVALSNVNTELDG